MTSHTLTLQEFVARYRGEQQSERATPQPHFLDLCALLNQPPPLAADPVGDGFADVWLRDHFAWEYKGKRKNLDMAYRQLLLYREALGNPPLLVVCDIERYEVHTNWTNTMPRVYRFTNEDILAGPEPLRVLRALFTDPDSLRPGRTVAEVTEEAARRFASLADGLRERGIDPPRAAHFLTQLLFCLFAEDVGLLTRDAFGALVRFGAQFPAQFVSNVTALFAAMRDGGFVQYQRIDRFNGGLFAAIDPIDLTKTELNTLAQAAALDRGSVDTAIIGTLFERSLDPAKRAKLGAQYTERDDIVRVVEPVVMAALRREWEAVRAAAEQKHAEAGRPTGVQARRNRQAELGGLLLGFTERLAGVRLLDPACGSGNFLAVALGALLDLQKEVVAYGTAAGLRACSPAYHPNNSTGSKSIPTRRNWPRCRCGSPICSG